MAAKGKRGGARPGSGRKPLGRPPGTFNDKESEVARRKLKSLVRAKTKELVDAQIANALGIKYLVVRDKATGKFARVAKNVAETINPEQEIVEVWEERPNVHSFTDLMNRTIGKPAEHVEMDQTITGGLTVKWEGD